MEFAPVTQWPPVLQPLSAADYPSRTEVPEPVYRYMEAVRDGKLVGPLPGPFATRADEVASFEPSPSNKRG